jgi:hypothetical protein
VNHTSRSRIAALVQNELESKALRQWEAVEERRRVLAAMTFPVFASNPDPRAA